MLTLGTNMGMARFQPLAKRDEMMSKATFLAEIERKAGSRAEIARVLGIAPSRVTEMFKGARDLSYDEAVKLAVAYGVEPSEVVTVELLKPILQICLRYPPREWNDQAVQRLAEELEYGLQLLRNVPTKPPSQDVLDVAAHAIAARFRDKP